MLLQGSLMLMFAFVLSQMCSGASNFACTNSQVTSAARQAMVEDMNKKRSDAIKGGLVASIRDNAVGGKTPKGGNVYEIEYDCALEAKAQAYADQCKSGHSTNLLALGENLAFNSQVRDSKTAFLDANKGWWSEVNDVAWGKADANHYTQMAWGWTYAVGCGFKDCTGKLQLAENVVCQYAIAGNFNFDAMKALTPKVWEYPAGSPCTKDSECTNPNSNKCNTANGLCIYNGLRTTQVGSWSKTICRDHPLIQCEIYKVLKWCSPTASVGCHTSIETSGFCPASTYCPSSCGATCTPQAITTTTTGTTVAGQTTTTTKATVTTTTTAAPAACVDKLTTSPTCEELGITPTGSNKAACQDEIWKEECKKSCQLCT